MSSPIAQNRPAERIVYQAHLHWVILLRPFFFGLVGLTIFAIGLTSNAWLFVWISILPLVIAVLQVITAVMGYYLWVYQVTNRRVRIRTGLLRRRTIDLLLPKVESVEIQTPLLGQVMGYGTLIVIGTGGTHERFPLIDAPEWFRQAVYEQIEPNPV